MINFLINYKTMKKDKQVETEQITESRTPSDIINEIKQSKSEVMPKWEDLKKEYDPTLHKVVTDKTILTDTVRRGIPDMS
ncbi:MAG TPA: hypothetical protein VFC62_05655, partial [Atopostipes sp.]|nr:hypothetical protein [Atopostipes sp.]